MVGLSNSLIIQGLLAVPRITAASSRCKVQPGTAKWPSQVAWNDFNNTLGGALLKPLPPASVCDPLLPNYNKDACVVVGDQWTNMSFHANDPVSINWPNWQDDACLPTSVYNLSSTCNTDPFPHYVVDARNGDHVEKAVTFARDNNVRLSVKGTGHDYLGRNTNPGLSIWTHNIRGISLVDYRTDCQSNETMEAVKVAAGHHWKDVYSFLLPHNLMCVGGADGNVGIGGYLLGGGHSPISALYGLAADNILEIEVVTADGRTKIANKETNPDLFWALRGGGASALGVLLTATLRTVPIPSASTFLLNMTNTAIDASQNSNANIYKGLARFHKLLPSLSAAGITGYYYIGSTAAAPGATAPGSSRKVRRTMADTTHLPITLLFFGSAYDKTEQDIKNAFGPLIKFTDSVEEVNSTLATFPLQTIDPLGSSVSSIDTAGGNTLLTSRLFDEQSLQDEDKLALNFQKFENAFMVGHVVVAPGVQQFAPDSIAANSAWRKTIVHIVSGTSYPYKDEALKKSQEAFTTNVLGQAFRDQAPDMGCYLNEADVNEPNYQQAFWGDNYGRLVAFKRQIDPTGVFWCKSCVGSEDWLLGEDNILCKRA